jgi:hypothetical protein
MADTLHPANGNVNLIGLATLARAAFAGTDLTPLKAQLLDRVTKDENDANALLDLSVVLQLMGQREGGVSVQALALGIQQVYRLRYSESPAGLRLLAFLAPGDLAENNVLEFLLEGSDITLYLLYVAPDLPLPSMLPEHDLAMVAVTESDRNRPLLQHIEKLVKFWPRPVLCSADRIARLSRDRVCSLIPSAPGLVVPCTARVERETLERIARGELPVTEIVRDGDFPIIARPVDSQKGRGLARLDRADTIPDYLRARPERAFYVARYVDYRGRDGQFRKYRIVLIDGRPYVCHVAITENWMVHYLSAGMVESAEKRAQEAQAFAHFDADFDEGFACRHQAAFQTIAERLDLAYVGLDCGETIDGELLIFEVDSGMTVHAMDPVDIFPYKQPQMRKVFGAFRRMLAATVDKYGLPRRD